MESFIRNYCSAQFSRSVVSDSLRPHESQHTRPPCPSPAPGVHSSSCLLSRWYIQPSHPLLSPSLPTFYLSQHQGLVQWVSSLHQVAKVLELQLQLHHQSFQWIFSSDFFFFRMDRLDLLAVQGTLMSLLQHHSSKASILQRSALWMWLGWKQGPML